jgi:tetratricopeptide (TPR) repeat protein
LAVAQQHLFWQNLKANFQTASGWIAKTATLGKFVALVPLVVFGPLIVQELRRDVVTIEPIEVPNALSDKGYTPGVAGYRLRDALNAYAGATSPGDDGTSLNPNLDFVAHDDASLNSNLDLNIAARHELPDIVVPQIGLSLRAIVSTIRSVLHRTGHAISGELTLQDGKYALRVRIDGRQVFSTNYEAENPDDLMTKAAPWVMDIIRPAAHAMARYRVRKEEGLLKADEIIAHHKKSDINVQWAYLLKGSHALKRGNYDEARTMFSNASLNWNSEQPHIQLGILLLRQAKPEVAIDHFQRAVDINPKSAIAYNNIGVALATLANRDKAEPDVAKLNLEEAIKRYRHAIATEPRYALPYNNLGLALLHRDQIDEAIVRYRYAIEIDPKYLLAHWNLAFALQRQRSFDAAVTEYRAAIELATDAEQLAMLRTYLGDVLVLRREAGENDNLEGAILEYRRAIEIIHPRCYSWAHHNLGVIWRAQGKINNAIAEFRNAADCDQEKNQENQTIKENLEQALRTKETGAIKSVSLANQ